VIVSGHMSPGDTTSDERSVHIGLPS
jgi:hypothetical protein